MSYTPTNWVNEVTPLNADNMNKIEQGIKTNSDDISQIKNTTLPSIDEQILLLENKINSKIGVVTLENSAGTLSDEDFEKLINNNYSLKYNSSLYIKNADTETYSIFSKIISISNNNEVLLLNTDYFMISNLTKTYNRITTQHQTYSKTKIDNLIQNVTIPIDNEINSTSENPVQNKVIYAALAGKQGTLSSTQLDAVNSGIDSIKVSQIVTNTGNISTINAKIPTQASSENQLADKDFVNSTINSLSAFYITYDVNKNPFPTLSDLLNAQTYYYNGEPRVPTQNDYALVVSDATHDGASCRYIYQGSWTFQFIVNETPFTAAQIAAINSGITEALTNQITTNQSNITNLQTSKQNLISSTNKLNADFVDDANSINKFVSSTDITNWNNKANDNSVVHKTGNEDIYGLKTFDVRPKVGIEQELPSAYSRLDYIQSTGTQYINTGLSRNVNQGNVRKVTYDIEFDNITDRQTLFGYYHSDKAGDRYDNVYLNGVLKYLLGGTNAYNSNFTPIIGQRYIIESDIAWTSQSLKVDNETILSTNQTFFATDGICYLFAQHNLDYVNHSLTDRAAYFAKVKMYSCKIYDSNLNIVRDYVPCKRITDNLAGLYDLKTNTFYPSSSAYDFVAGPETVPSDDSLVMLKGDIDKITTFDGTETEINGLVLKGERVKFPQGQIIQVDTMPSASSSNNGKIVQYIGTTTLTYTNGYFYKSNGTSWDNINVQPSSGEGSGITNYEVIDRVNSIPTATATSPDFVQVNGVNYAKKRTIDLTNTTWLINSTPSMPTGDPTYSINFTSNNSNFNLFIFITTGGYRDLIYSDTELTNGVHTYSEQDDEWSDGTAYQTIAITGGNDANNEALYNWLIENATLQSGTVVGYEYESIGGLGTYHYFEEV